MNSPRKPYYAGTATLAQVEEFDEVIDARSPAEFAEDHLPGAINCPALSDEERARVGTLYKQVSPFEARKVGAAFILHRIGQHLETRFRDRDRAWRPLVYCWRGGKRSGAFTHVLREIGWNACALEGGYKTYRRMVVSELQRIPPTLSYRVLTGATGSGKSRVLQALAAQGAQILDLETLAAHKGSVLGPLPDETQPTQKAFESELYARLRAFDPGKPVFVEAESRKIGLIQLPDALLDSMRAGACLEIDASLPARVAFLQRDYDYFIADPPSLLRRMDRLRGFHSNAQLSHWRNLAERGEWPALVEELLSLHYDPHYQRSQNGNYARYAQAAVFSTDDLSPAAISTLAQRILAG